MPDFPRLLGATPCPEGVAFGLWAPNAKSVRVAGEFNAWSDSANPLEPDGHGNWFGLVAEARVGHGYQFALETADGTLLKKIDPRAMEVSNSVGHGIVVDHDSFDWQGDDFTCPPLNELVIYELHVGTFFDPKGQGESPGDFDDLRHRLGHLLKLGVNAIQLMPVAEFAGDYSWGYNPAHIYAVESSYGGCHGLKTLVRAAHAEGLAVILDVVYNHFGPSDLDLWQLDGWGEGGKGGIYFYNDERSSTPWGDTRPDYGRGEVRSFIRDNALHWLDHYHLDGLRFDMTVYIRQCDAFGGDIPDGWGLLQWVNREIHQAHPRAVTIAEDLHTNAWITRDDGEGGAGFDSQWDAQFVHPVRRVITQVDDNQRDMNQLTRAVAWNYNGDAFQRVIYTESHDEVANGKSRVPEEIDPDDPTSWFAQKRSTLGAGLVFTAPGIPMLFQGQEFLQGGWFRDDVPLDWDQNHEFAGIVRLYRDLVRLRLNRDGNSRGLTGGGLQVSHVNDLDKVVAFRRWRDGGAGDEVLVVANFSNQTHDHYTLGVAAPGRWELLLNSAARVYGADSRDTPSTGLEARAESYDGLPARAELIIGPYSLLVFAHPR